MKALFSNVYSEQLTYLWLECVTVFNTRILMMYVYLSTH